MPQATEATHAELPLAALRIDGGTQQRETINEAVVAEYAEDVDALPPVVVFHDGADHWLAGGFHRYHAHRKAGKEAIRAEVRKGTRRDAVLFACGDNAEHGLRRGNADKRKAVTTLLRDPEWRGWADRQIARLCRVSNTFVARVRQDLTGDIPSETKADSLTVNVDSEDGAAKPAGRTYRTKHGGTSTMKPREKKPAAPTNGQADNGQAAAAPAPPPEPEEAPPEPGKDALGIPVPLTAATAFADREHYREARSLLRRLAALVTSLAQSPGGAHLAPELSRREAGGRIAFRATQLEEFRSLLNGSEPHAAVCPWCHRDHPGHFERDCKACQGLGWVPLRLWRRAPAEDQERVRRDFANATA
jgi:hypothetical protein